MTDLKAAIEEIFNAEDKVAALLELFNEILAYMFKYIGAEI